MRKSILGQYIIKLLGRAHLLSAQDIVKHLEIAEYPYDEYNKSSVYRALDQLLAKKIIRRHVFSEEAQFDLSEPHHDHLVCEKCGKVEHTEPLFVQPEYINQFLVKKYDLTLSGICSTCQKK